MRKYKVSSIAKPSC